MVIKVEVGVPELLSLMRTDTLLPTRYKVKHYSLAKYYTLSYAAKLLRCSEDKMLRILSISGRAHALMLSVKTSKEKTVYVHPDGLLKLLKTYHKRKLGSIIASELKLIA